MRIFAFACILLSAYAGYAQPYQSPKLLFDEDFTDGVFDDFGSGVNGNAWSFMGFSKFDTTINRPFPKAALRKISDGAGQGWDALVFWELNGGANVLFDKKDDVVALKFKAFSDVAGNRISPDFGVEVAMLEDKAGAPFGHDLSFEVCQVWLRPTSSEGPLQLDANVENTNAVFNTGTTRSHHTVAGGKETSATLDSAYDSEVIWRNRFGTNTSNIEVWGKINASDFDIPAEMKSSTAPINPDYLQFNNLQIALFDKCPACTTSARALLRDGTNFQNAQLGIANCRLGITKVSDFNIDYQINATDSDTLAANVGRIVGATIKKGDATNDGKVNVSDAAAIVGFWSGAIPQNATALATYNPANGEVKLSLSNISYFKVVSLSNQLTGGIPLLTALNAKLHTDTDSIFGAYTDESWTVSELSIGTIAALGLSATDLKLWVNFKGSGLRDGILLDFGQELVTGIQTPILGKTILVDGLVIQVPTTKGKVQVRISNGMGQQIFAWKGEMENIPQNINTKGNGFKTIQIVSVDSRKVFLVRKYQDVK
jgi:hypothetical protein